MVWITLSLLEVNTTRSKTKISIQVLTQVIILIKVFILCIKEPLEAISAPTLITWMRLQKRIHKGSVIRLLIHFRYKLSMICYKGQESMVATTEEPQQPWTTTRCSPPAETCSCHSTRTLTTWIQVVFHLWPTCMGLALWIKILTLLRNMLIL